MKFSNDNYFVINIGITKEFAILIITRLRKTGLKKSILQ